MSDADDIDLEAAEYVLGTLDPAERARIVERLPGEPQLAAAVQLWEEWLSPLSEAMEEVEPPEDGYQRLAERLFGGMASVAPRRTEAAASPQLHRRVRRWQAATAGFAALAASLAAWIAIDARPSRVPRARFAAVLQSDPSVAAMILDVDVEARRLVIHPLAASAPAGRSYELWLIDRALGPPRSLGIVPPRAESIAALTAIDPGIIAGATYAVTIEPLGGSPDGKPSGAPVLSGKLAPAS